MDFLTVVTSSPHKFQTEGRIRILMYSIKYYERHKTDYDFIIDEGNKKPSLIKKKCATQEHAQ
jgi:hypothetical protein